MEKIIIRKPIDFKFRYWSKKSKKMSGIFSYKGSPFLGKGHYMQYSGKQDINKKLVFEGDILINEDINQYCVVRFVDGKFISDYGSAEHFGKYNHSRFDLNDTINNLHFVCGNIFEDKELISELIFM